MKGSAELEGMSLRAPSTCTRGCAAGRWPVLTPVPGSAPTISSYLGKGDQADQAFVRFAARYASLNEADFRRHAEAVSAGEVPCETEG